MIVNIEEKIFISPEQLEKFQWNFQARCDLWKKLQQQSFTFSRRDILEKLHAEVQIDPTAFLGLTLHWSSSTVI